MHAKLLSNAGREILIKAVAQATATYTMSCFKLPDFLCRELNALVSQFWWGQKEKERKMAWISWKKMCTPKSEGGMGFKDLKAFNLALLAKQGWRLNQYPDSLTHRVFKAKYFAKCTFMEAQVGKKPSYVWRSLMAAKETIEAGSRWLIGNGRKVNIWRDRWLPLPDSSKVISPQRHNTEVEMVAQLIDNEVVTWKSEFIREVSLPHEVDIILSIPLSTQMLEDSKVWAWSKNGLFTMRSAYGVSLKLLRKTSQTRPTGDSSDKTKVAQLWKTVWKLKCPNKIKHFLWRACKEILPTNYRLAARKVSKNDRCGFCGECESSGYPIGLQSCC